MNLCGAWESCMADPTHRVRTERTTPSGDFNYQVDLCDVHLIEELSNISVAPGRRLIVTPIEGMKA
jgi:hypothetical protein